MVNVSDSISAVLVYKHDIMTKFRIMAQNGKCELSHLYLLVGIQVFALCRTTPPY